MGHLVHAAEQLRSEIISLSPKTKVEVVGETDGLGFDRSIRITTEAAKGLGEEVVQALENDPRIESVVKSSKGVRFTFVSDTRADFTTSFGLAEAVAVLSED